MLAVSNTTPLRYLIAIGQERLFEQLFTRVLIPTAVQAELTDARTPVKVRQWMSAPPTWLQEKQVKATAEFPATLHAGEREAILLAEEMSADIVLIDEHYGRAVALGRRLPVSGTLGVIERADTVGILRDLPGTIQSLKSSGFYITESLERQIVERHRIRRGV
jgi:predicted nucleic acid-binding protein